MIACIGIDLAWSSRNQSGLAMLRLDAQRKRVELREVACLQTDEEITAWVTDRRLPVTIVAIDAPIIAPNPAGTGRLCDKEVSRAFWSYHAGAYSANRPKCARPIALRRRFERLGFDCDPTKAPGRVGKWVIEVYPHPAQVVLFSLSRIVKYKKGRVADKQRGQQELAGHIVDHLPRKTPSLGVNDVLRSLCAPPWLKGQALKAREDQLDAVVCGYLAAYYWSWSGKLCRIFGDVAHGCIVTPWPIEQP